jgi:hypothetical protein
MGEMSISSVMSAHKISSGAVYEMECLKKIEVLIEVTMSSITTTSSHITYNEL